MLTSNQHYGGLNRRFDKRAALLRKLGYKYVAINVKAVAGIETNSRDSAAFFVRFRRPSISAAVLHFADKRSWLDVLRSALR